jgi:DNA-binding NarL/FixJ family response regulator
VVGQFHLVVEVISRPLAAVARVTPIPLEACTSLSTARDVVLRSKPDVVVLVLAVSDLLDPHDMVAELAGHGQRVVAVGQTGDPRTEAELVRDGAAATIGSDRGITDILTLIEDTAKVPLPGPRGAGGPPTRDRALSPDRRVRRNLSRLTPAEARILWRMMHGSSVKEIARAHVVSVETVRSQIRTVLTKLEASSQLAAAALAWQAGWMPAEVTLRAA